MSPSSAPRSASERSVSFRWVQLAVPMSSRRTRSRRSSKVVPRNRSALATAAGHSAHGSTRALAHRSTIRRRRASIDPPTAHSWTTVSWPSSSTWLSRECTSMACRPSDPGASTTSRRRRRVAPGGSGAMACQAWGSSPGDARGGAAGPWGVARRPVSLRLAMKPPIERPAGALVAQPGDRGVHHARLRGQGVGVEQGVAGNQHRSHEVVEQEMEDRAAVSLGRQGPVHHAAEAGTDPGADQRPKVGEVGRVTVGLDGPPASGRRPRAAASAPPRGARRPGWRCPDRCRDPGRGRRRPARRAARRGGGCRSRSCGEPIRANAAASTWPGLRPAGGRSPARLHAGCRGARFHRIPLLEPAPRECPSP